ncbi:hypothetical protein MKX01_025796 [Papaver californicum]|nr:hypothetical protein MKX01_025796 [Papaver californicum]
MTNKTPIFPIPQHPHHFSDYGFDPQIYYLHVLEEAKKHKKEKFLPSTTATTSRSIESLHFKLQKPISKEESSKKKKQKSKWCKNALLFCKKKWVYQNDQVVDHHFGENNYIKNINYKGTISGPVYITETRIGSSTLCRSTLGPLSDPLEKNSMNKRCK